MNRSSRFAAALLLFSIAARADDPPSDREAARILYNQGLALRDKGELAAALSKFEKAHMLGKTPITALVYARALVNEHRLVDADGVLSEVATLDMKNESEKSKQARADCGKLAAEVKSRLAHITVLVAGQPTSITLDSASIAEGEHVIDPGHHEVVARSETGNDTTTLDIAEGETKSVTLVLPTQPMGSLAVTTLPPPSGRVTVPDVPPNRTPSYVAGSIGVGALVLGAISGTIVLVDAAHLEGACPNGSCPPSESDTLSRVQALSVISNVSFIVGGIAIAVAVAAWFWPRNAQKPMATAIAF